MSAFVAGYLVAFIQGWKLTLVAIATLPLMVAAGGIVAVLIQSKSKGSIDAFAEAAKVVEQILGSIRTVSIILSQLHLSYFELLSQLSSVPQALALLLNRVSYPFMACTHRWNLFLAGSILQRGKQGSARLRRGRQERLQGGRLEKFLRCLGSLWGLSGALLQLCTEPLVRINFSHQGGLQWWACVVSGLRHSCRRHVSFPFLQSPSAIFVIRFAESKDEVLGTWGG